LAKADLFNLADANAASCDSASHSCTTSTSCRATLMSGDDKHTFLSANLAGLVTNLP